MTTAPRMQDLFSLIPSETNNGSKWDNFREYMALANFTHQCTRMCKCVEYPLGTNSCDPTTQFVFDDGSVLEVANPSQDTYPAYVTVIN